MYGHIYYTHLCGSRLSEEIISLLMCMMRVLFIAVIMKKASKTKVCGYRKWLIRACVCVCIK